MGHSILLSKSQYPANGLFANLSEKDGEMGTMIPCCSPFHYKPAETGEIGVST
jgi:hypothetical protein